MICTTRHLIQHVLLSAALLLGGCSILPEAEPQTRYDLPAAPMAALQQNKDHSLYVATPNANRLINSNRVIVQPDGSEMQVYKGTQWADNAPVILRDRLVQALHDAQLFQAVSTDAAVKTKWALESYLRHFQVQYRQQQPVVVVQLEAQLIDRAQSVIQRSQRFVIEQPATSTDIPAVIQAFGMAGDQLSQQLLQWLAQ